jgi:thiosulfate reductase cytochrome b subunit
MADKVYLYPVWVRLWHLANAFLCLMLIITGISMQYSNPGYPIIRFDIAVFIHNLSGILLTISYLVFFTGNLITGNGKYYKIIIKGFIGQLKKQSRYYILGIFKGEKAPFKIDKTRKFNPLQQFSYVLVMYMVLPVTFITGWGLLFPEVILNKVFGFNGILLTDILHIIMGFIITIFLFIHVYFCTIGATTGSNFQAMITGYHESHE